MYAYLGSFEYKFLFLNLKRNSAKVGKSAPADEWFAAIMQHGLRMN
jgi:hypothetical protein